jgi:hypothetical protein
MAWLYQSRKAQVALGAILSIVLSRLLPRLGFTPEDVNAIGMAIGAVASVWIGGIAHEDAAAKKAPQNQTNVNSEVVNAPPAPAAKPDPFTPDQLDFIYSQIRQRAQRAKPAPPPAPPAPSIERIG